MAKLNKNGGHSSGWGAFGHNKGLDPLMQCLTLIYLEFFYLKASWWKTCKNPSHFDYFNAKNVDKLYF